MAKKLTKGKRKYLSELVDCMAANARAEVLRKARIATIKNDLRDHRGRRMIDIIW